MLIAALVAALLGADPQTPVDRDCMDDQLRDRCTAADRARVEAKLGLTSIEAEAAAGAEVYRARFVDGYGQDMLAVAFVRRPGQDPMVEIHGHSGRRMTAPIAPETWDAVVARSRFADRELAPVQAATDANAPPPICLHSWVAVVEMANSRRDGEAAPVRRATQGACGGGLAMDYALALAEQAARAVAPCRLIDRQRQRNDVTLLATCLELEGDRFTAAALWNHQLKAPSRWDDDRSDAMTWQLHLGMNARPVLNWQGQVVMRDGGRGSAAAQDIARRLEATPDMMFEPIGFRGLSSQEGEVVGRVVMPDGRVAPYRQRWAWDPNMAEWKLERWTVEAFSATD